MAIITTLGAIIVCLSFVFGQLLRLQLFGIELPLIDIGLVITAISQLIINLKQKNIKINIFLLFFIIFSLFLFIFNHFLHNYLLLKPLFYFIRLSALIFLFIFLSPSPPSQKILLFFRLCLISNVIFGLIQYFIWPDFTYFQSFGWDPHLSRLVSTFFDPTFTGLIYLFLLIDCYFSKNYKLLFITYLALALTYSRSSLLAFLIAFIFISIKQKNIKVFYVSLLVCLLTILALPRYPGEGTKLERMSSIKAKIENYQQGFKLYFQSPIFGIGYNHIGLARTDGKSGHETWGYDNSLLNIAISNGIIGLLLFIFGFFKHFKSQSTTTQTMIITLLIHSLFANSILYPWSLLAIYFFQFKYHI